MKLYSVTDKYIDYLRQFDYKVYDNKEDRRKVMRKNVVDFKLLEEKCKKYKSDNN